MATPVVPKEDFDETLRALCTELWAHAHDGPGGADDPEVVAAGCFRSGSDLARLNIAQAGGGRARFDLWWTNCPSEGLPVLLWDSWECQGLTRAEYDGMLQRMRQSRLALSRVVDADEWREDAPPLRPLPTWKYHPERFKGVMPFAQRIAQIGRQSNGSPDVDTLNGLLGAWQDADMHGFAARPLRARLRSPSRDSRALHHLVDMLMFHAVFCANGRQIFDIPPQLCEMFRRTDVDDIAAENIKVPYPGIYLHFGPQPDLALDDRWTPEGAYVHDLGGGDDGDRALQFCIVSAPTSLEDYRQFGLNIEPVYVQALGPQHMKMALGEAVDMVLCEKLQELERQMVEEPLAKFDDQAQQMAADHGVQLVSMQSKRASGELRAMGPKHRTYLEMLKLIVNSLAYVTAYPKDIETKWPANTPSQPLKELSKTDNRNERRRIQSRLAALGFTPVHICGRRLADELTRQAGAAGGGHPSAHWRRGHWRRQPHGPQNSLRKLVWLMPVLVNPGKSQDEPLGHLYLVS